jgi:hypothetical protein
MVIFIAGVYLNICSFSRYGLLILFRKKKQKKSGRMCGSLHPASCFKNSIIFPNKGYLSKEVGKE